MEKIQLHLYKYEDSQFKQIAIIDNYQEYSFEHNLYKAGQFTVTINFNIPNAKLFERGLFIKFGEDKYCFGEILTISDTVGPDGKGSQLRNIMGLDIRYLLKRRVIKNMNNGGNWVMTDKGEICLRNLINDQCGSNAENKRKLPIINIIPLPANAIGKEYSVSEEFSNLYEVCKTIATQSEFGWRIKFENGELTLECFEGNDLRNSVFFSPDFDSLASGNLSDSNNSYSNAIYVAGKGQNEERDLYEGETVENDITPEGMGRFESFDNQSQMTTEDEYKAEAFSMLAQYGQTLEMTGQGLIKCPYIFKEQYNIGDKITLSFNNKKSVVKILAVTERSVKGTYSLNFNFGKPENTLKDQLQIILKKLQMASNKGSAVDCVKWYTIPTDSEMNKADVTFNTIGFTGNNSNQDFTFILYADDEKTGSKNYMVYIKNLIGTGKLILTTGKEDAQNLSLLGGTYIANIFVDEDGNVKLNSATPTTVIEANNPMPVTSGAVYEEIQQGGGSSVKIPTGAVFPFAGITAPEGFLFCDGSAVSRVTYSKLLGVIGETYGSGDGSTTFNLPDYRETVLVGAGQNEKLSITEHDVYNIGEFKDDQMQGHWHSMNGKSSNASGGGGVLYEPEAYANVAKAKKIISDGENGTPRIGSTTHGKQIGINFIIKV